MKYVPHIFASLRPQRALSWKILMRKMYVLLPFALAGLLCAACGNKSVNPNWLEEDDVDAAIDETFLPIMDELVQAFWLEHPEATMKPLYVSEDSAIRLVLYDSLRCCIVTRMLNENEQDIVKSHRLSAKQSLIAYDAIALVVNKANEDSLITLGEVKQIVQGKISRWEELEHSGREGKLSLVFDHSGSSTVRFMRDSLCHGENLQGEVYASEGGTNESVLEMVKANPDIIGVVGTNWLKDRSAATLSNFDSLEVRVLRVARNEDSKFVRPFQYFIATGDYPLIRPVYAITTDPRTKSLVKYFYFYVKGQKGQTIICNQSQLLPNAPVQVKAVNMK